MLLFVVVLHAHMASHNPLMSYLHKLTARRRWYHHLPYWLSDVYMGVLVDPVQHTIFSLKAHLLLSFHGHVSSAPVLLQTFVFVLQSHKLVSVHNSTL